MKISVLVEDDSGRKFHGEGILTPQRKGSKSAQLVSTAGRSAPSSKGRKPKDALKTIYQRGAFKSEKSLAAIQDDLAKLEYNFPKSTLMMALGTAPYLTKKGTRGKFRWIQRYKPGT